MPEAIQTTRYRTFDGLDFPTLAEAEAHEEANFESIISGLTLEQVRAAVSRQPEALAISDAIERAGNLIARARRAAGDLRRKPNADRQEPPAAPPSDETAAAV